MQLWHEVWVVSMLREPLYIRLLVIFAITAVLHGVSSLLLHRLKRVAEYSRSYLDDALVYGASRPLPALIWLLGLAYMAKLYAKAHHPEEWLEMISLVRDIGFLLVVSWFFWRTISEFRQQLMTRDTRSDSQVDQTTIDALCKLGYLLVVVITLITFLQTIGISISGLLAAGGIGGIAIGFAAKDILANFFGGLTIYLDRPFSVGDWIRSPDKDIEGTVEMISWRHTRIRRFNKNPIYIPNMLFTTIAVENPSRMSHRRIRETIGIRYADLDKMAGIVSAIRDMLQHHPEIDQSQTLIVNFVTFNKSSLDIMIYAFTRTRVWEEYHHVKQDVLLKVGEVISALGAEVAFPTQTLHLATLPEPQST